MNGWNSLVRRAARGVLFLGVVILLMLATVLIVLSIAPGRNQLLGFGLDRVTGNLPGSISWTRATWPSLGELAFEDVHWVVGDSVLVERASGRVKVDLWRLRHRDLRVLELNLEAVTVVLPRIQRALASTPEGEPEVDQGKDGEVGFPRVGSWGGLPSLAVESFVVRANDLVLSDSVRVDSELQGALGLLHGGEPSVLLDGNLLVEPVRGWPFQLQVQSREIGTLSFLAGEADVPVEWGVPITVSLDCSYSAETGSIEGIAGNGTLSVPSLDDLSRRPGCEGFRETGVNGAFEADLRVKAETGDRPHFELDLRLVDHEWLQRADLRFHWVNGILSMDSFDVESQGSELSASGTYENSEDGAGPVVDLELALDLVGGEVLRPWFDPAELPSGLSGELRAHLQGSVATPRVDLQVDARADPGSSPFETVSVSALTESLGRTPIVVAGDAYVAGPDPLLLQLRAAVEQGEDRWLARLEPLRVNALKVRPPGPPGSSGERSAWVGSMTSRVVRGGRQGLTPSLGGEIRIASTGALDLDDVEVVGNLGHFTADGRLDSGQSGLLAVRGEWRNVPQPLFSRLGEDIKLVDRLRAIWIQDGPYYVDGTVQFNPPASEAAGSGSPGQSVGLLPPEGDDVFRLVAEVELHLPGPRLLKAFRPEATMTDSLGPSRGRARILVEGVDWSFHSNLEGRGWLEESRVSIVRRGGETVVDSSYVRLPGMELRAIGQQSASGVDFRASVEIDSLLLLPTLGFEVPDYDHIAIRANTRWAGTDSAAVLDFELEGKFLAPGLKASEVHGDGYWSKDSTAISIRLPAGLETPSIRVDDAVLAFAGTLGPSPQGRILFSADGSELGLHHSGDVSRDSTEWRVATDSLRLVLDGESLENETPFLISFDAETERLEISDLALRGTLGSIRADGVTSRDVVDLELRADLDLPEQPSSLELPPGLWPREVLVDLQAKGPAALSLESQIRGLSLGGKTDLVAEVMARSEPDGAVVEAVVVSETDSLLYANGRVPLRVTVYPPDFSIDPGAIDLRLETKGFPISIFANDTHNDPQGTGVVTSSITLSGSTDFPTIIADGELSFPDWEEMNAYVLGFDGEYKNESEEIESRLWIRRSGKDRMTGEGTYPLSVSLHPFDVKVASEAAMSAELQSGTIVLEELSPLLGGDYTVDGTCRLNLTAKGDPLDPELTGRFESEELSVRFADGSHFGGNSELSFAGTGRNPQMRGRVNVTGGVFVLPETPKDLLPVTGTSRLWVVADSLRVSSSTRSPSSNGPVPEGTQSDSLQSAPRIAPEMDVVVDIPGSFWIRGGGLEVELAGRIDVEDHGVLSVNGNLEAREGHLTLLGRYFEVDEGTVGFYGEEDIDPALDLKLSTRVSDTLIQVEVTGQASAPRLKLRSEPEMPEGDIMSFLILGRPLDELDEDQVGLLRSRATDLAAAYGTAQIGESIAGQLGIDLVSVQQSSEDEGGSALVFGKYLSPRILLKYEQALGEGQGWLLNLEYLLTEHLRLESLYGQQNQSGAEINWINEY